MLKSITCKNITELPLMYSPPKSPFNLFKPKAPALERSNGCNLGESGTYSCLLICYGQYELFRRTFSCAEQLVSE